MDETFDTIESLRARAEDFRVRADTCKTDDRYASLMRKGAAHLDEEVRRLESCLHTRPI